MFEGGGKGRKQVEGTSGSSARLLGRLAGDGWIQEIHGGHNGRSEVAA